MNKIVVSIFNVEKCTRDVFRSELAAINYDEKTKKYQLKLKGFGIKNRFFKTDGQLPQVSELIKYLRTSKYLTCYNKTNISTQTFDEESVTKAREELEAAKEKEDKLRTPTDFMVKCSKGDWTSKKAQSIIQLRKDEDGTVKCNIFLAKFQGKKVGQMVKEGLVTKVSKFDQLGFKMHLSATSKSIGYVRSRIVYRSSTEYNTILKHLKACGIKGAKNMKLKKESIATRLVDSEKKRHNFIRARLNRA